MATLSKIQNATATYVTCRVENDLAGLKLTQWMRRYVSKDWRQIQKFYLQKRIWVVPENTPLQFPTPTPAKEIIKIAPNASFGSGGMLGEDALSASANQYSVASGPSVCSIDELLPEHDRGRCPGTSETADDVLATRRPGCTDDAENKLPADTSNPVPVWAQPDENGEVRVIPPKRKGHRHGDLKVKREKPRGERILKEGETVVFARACVHRKFRHLLPERVVGEALDEESKEDNGGAETSTFTPGNDDEERGVDELQGQVCRRERNKTKVVDAAPPPSTSSFTTTDPDLVPLAPATAPEEKLRALCSRVLFLDTDYLVFDKPAGLPWGATLHGSEFSLRTLLIWYLHKRELEVQKLAAEGKVKRKKNVAKKQKQLQWAMRKLGRENGEAISTAKAATKAVNYETGEEMEMTDEATEESEDCSSSEDQANDNTEDAAAKQKEPIPMIEDELFPVHRLPTDMAGCMIVSRSETASVHAKEASKARTFAQHKYLAVVRTVVSDRDSCTETKDRQQHGGSGGASSTSSSTIAPFFFADKQTSSARRKSGAFSVLRLPMRLDPVLKILLPAPPDVGQDSVQTAVLHYRELRRATVDNRPRQLERESEDVFSGIDADLEHHTKKKNEQKNKTTYSLIEVIPQTPEEHLMRAALAFGLGMPVVDDLVYERALRCKDLAAEGRRWEDKIEGILEGRRVFGSNCEGGTTSVDATAARASNASGARARTTSSSSTLSVLEKANRAADNLSRVVAAQNEKLVDGIGVLPTASSQRATATQLNARKKVMKLRQEKSASTSEKESSPRTSVFDARRSPTSDGSTSPSAEATQTKSALPAASIVSVQPEDFEDIVDYSRSLQKEKEATHYLEEEKKAEESFRRRASRMKKVQKLREKGPFGEAKKASGGAKDDNTQAKMQMYLWQVTMRTFAGKDVVVKAKPPTYLAQAIQSHWGSSSDAANYIGRTTMNHAP
ncbi:unnamed protein product [Amoebophrya sp. A120]|nr:unnamed protein product [Amoebophrya sp. A120]|eukprot:GSA120T00017631001.1